MGAYPVQHRIDFNVPEAAASWPERMEAACRVLEEAFPGEKLNEAAQQKKSGEWLHVADRPAYFKKLVKTKRRWLTITNGKAVVGRGDTGFRDEGVINVGGVMVRPYPEYFSLSVMFRESPLELCEKIMVAIGDAVWAYTGQLTPLETSLRLRGAQLGHDPIEDLSWLSAQLPQLRYCAYDGLEAAEQPEILGWMNYWSETTCRYLGFPDRERDRPLLAHSYATPKGAWLVKVSAEPLDVRLPQHLEVLSWAYERFPKLGVRAQREPRAYVARVY